jgi:TonB-linked SusC/RagA family outer membrane protein
MNSLLKQISLTCLLFLFTITAMAQNQTSNAANQITSAASPPINVVRGVITDQEGEPLPGAIIKVKNDTKKTTVADVNGEFELTDVPGNAILVVAFLGFKNTEYNINNRAQIEIILQNNAVELEEVFVTGYGTFKKSAYAGSASVIRTEKLEDVPVLSVNDLLLGNASGVAITSGSSQPGAPNTIRIRGIGSFNASKEPLYVIDGIPVISGNVSSISSISSNPPGTDIMSTLNTSDIENIAVIKDAAAASLYGSRAANGVILITTKSGKSGKASFNVKADMGFSNFALPYRTVMGGQERRDLITEGLRNEYNLKGSIAGYTDATDYVDKNIDKYAPVPWCGFVNWDDYLFRTGFYQNYEASVSGGSDIMRYFSSVNYTNQEGATYNSGLRRITARLNADWNITKKFTVGIKALFSDVDQDVFSEGTSYTSPFYSSRNAVSPSDPVYLEDGTYNRAFIRNSDRNPKLAMDYSFKKEALTRAFNTVYGQYEFIDNLKFKTTYSYDFNLSTGDTFDDPRTSDGRSSKGSRTKNVTEYNKWVWSNALSYNFSFLENHRVDVLAAFDMESYYMDYLQGNTKNFAIPDMNSIGLGSEPGDVYGNPEDWRMASFISRLNYDYLSKYYFGASLRYDGTSRLSREGNNRWGMFWSLSGAWRISEENFMANLRSILTDVKLRVSYGTNGTQPSAYYGYYSLSSLSSSYAYQSSPGIAADQIANPDLQWESNYNLNVGLDVELFNRVNVTFEVYNRLTKNLLMNFPVSRTTGFSSYLKNVGEVQNSGVELEITSRNIENNDFRWTTSFNIGHNKNEIVKWDGIVTEQVSGNWIYKVGMPYYTYYLYEFAGIDPADGRAEFYLNTTDDAGNITSGREKTKDYTQAERIATKTFDPVVSGGLTNTFSYKWFDLSFLFNYSFGGYTYDNGAQKSEHGGSDLQANIPDYYSARWQNPGDVTDIEQFIANRSASVGGVSMYSIASTRRLHSADFIRLKNLTFAIRLPKRWIQPMHLEQVRLYCSGSNLLTWAKWDKYDPEVATGSGSVEWEQPPLKTWTFGIDIKF